VLELLLFERWKVTMGQTIVYRKQVLLAVEAFLEATPDSIERGHQIIRTYLDEISREEMYLTLDWFLWYDFLYCLTDLVFYKEKRYLQEVSNLLQGKQPQLLQSCIYQEDFRPYFTERDQEWYRQAEHMLAFLHTLPFSELHPFFTPATQEQEEAGEAIRGVPEEIMNQCAQVQTAYEQRKEALERLSQEHPLAEDVGQEKISHVIFQIVTTLLTGLFVGWQAMYSGYPVIWRGTVGGTLARGLGNVDATEDILRAQRLLATLAGQRPLFFSWSVCKASSLGADAFLFHIQ
jgi:hypothetical protein